MPPRQSQSKKAVVKAATTPVPRASSTRKQSKPGEKAKAEKIAPRQPSPSKAEEADTPDEPFILNGKPDPIRDPLISADVQEVDHIIQTLCLSGFHLGHGAIIKRSDGSPLLVFRVHAGPVEVSKWPEGYQSLPFAGWVSAPLAFLLAKMHCLVRVRVEIELDAPKKQRSVEPIYDALYHSRLLSHVLQSLPTSLKRDAVPDHSALTFSCHALDCWIARLAHDTGHDTEGRVQWMSEHGEEDHSPYEGNWNALGMLSNLLSKKVPYNSFIVRLCSEAR